MIKRHVSGTESSTLTVAAAAVVVALLTSVRPCHGESMREQQYGERHASLLVLVVTPFPRNILPATIYIALYMLARRTLVRASVRPSGKEAYD